MEIAIQVNYPDPGKATPEFQMCSNRSHQSSASSGASVDEERAGRSQNGCLMFGNDPLFETERRKLLKRVSSTDGVTTGDCDHKTRLLERLGGGSFGEVYLGELIETKQRVAVKIEPTSCALQSLLHEGNAYRKLEEHRGLPHIYWYGMHGCDFTAMVMDLMGPTLYERWVDCGQKFSMKTVLLIIDQMLDIIEHVHTHYFVHRDISPNNFMLGFGENSAQLYLIDFGHAKELDPSPKFIPARRGRMSPAQALVGTPRFASVFTHMGAKPSFRDDMESLGYMWIYLLKGKLPWQGLRPKEPHQNKLDLIAQTKYQILLETLCEGLPGEFAEYMNYVRNLRYLEMPDHQQVKEFFRAFGRSQNIEYDNKFDWISKEVNAESSSSHEAPSLVESAETQN